MNKNHTNEPNYTKLVMPRQLVLPLDYGMLIKETAPVRLLDAVLEELDYKELQRLYSPKGRKSKGYRTKRVGTLIPITER